MRTWLLAVSALTLVALTSPIAGEKRSSVLAVRVNVVRSCSVTTEPGLQGGGTVSCGTRFGPPVMSTNSTISMPAAPAPPAMIETTAVAGNRANPTGDARETESARPSDVTVQRISETVTAPVAAPAPGEPVEAVTIRVMTVNF